MGAIGNVAQCTVVEGTHHTCQFRQHPLASSVVMVWKVANWHLFLNMIPSNFTAGTIWKFWCDQGVILKLGFHPLQSWMSRAFYVPSNGFKWDAGPNFYSTLDILKGILLRAQKPDFFYYSLQMTIIKLFDSQTTSETLNQSSGVELGWCGPKFCRRLFVWMKLHRRHKPQAWTSPWWGKLLVFSTTPTISERGEPATSYRWIGWIWGTTSWSSRLEKTDRSL
jgi:hypothetical protein